MSMIAAFRPTLRLAANVNNSVAVPASKYAPPSRFVELARANIAQVGREQARRWCCHSWLW